jgi:hypothetical protein
MTQKKIEKNKYIAIWFLLNIKILIFVIEFLDPELDPDPQCGSTTPHNVKYKYFGINV